MMISTEIEYLSWDVSIIGAFNVGNYINRLESAGVVDN